MGKNGKNGKNKRAYAAKTKALRQNAQDGESQKLLASNEMITKVVDKDFAGLLKVKLLSNGLLNASLSKSDVRVPIYNRNAAQSPLLCLPAEIRNKIFRMVVGDQHIHISVRKPPQKPAEESDLHPVIIKERDVIPYNYHRYVTRDLRYDKRQRTCDPWINNTYPLDWRAYYTTQPAVDNQKTKFLYEMIPEKRKVWGSGNHMTQFTRVCRQIYDEVGLLTYSTNEFSFCSPFALTAWLENRLLPQRQAIKVLWVDNEWSGYGSAPETLKDLCPAGATLKVSQLTWTVVSEAYWNANASRHLGDTPAGDIDADGDNMAEFGNWIVPIREADHLEVEWVQDWC